MIIISRVTAVRVRPLIIGIPIGFQNMLRYFWPGVCILLIVEGTLSPQNDNRVWVFIEVEWEKSFWTPGFPKFG